MKTIEEMWGLYSSTLAKTHLKVSSAIYEINLFSKFQLFLDCMKWKALLIWSLSPPSVSLSPCVALSVKKGDRVAQLVCERICYPDLMEEQVQFRLRGFRNFHLVAKTH